MLHVVIMSWVFLGGAIGAGLIGPNRDAIELEYGLSKSQFGAALAGIQFVFAGAVLLAAGRLRRLGMLGILLAALTAQAVGFAVIFLTSDILALGAGWALVILGSMLGAQTNNISMDLWAHNPRRGVLMLHAFNAAGKAAGPLVVAFCLVMAWSWRMSFLLMGGATLVLAMLVVAILRTARPSASAPSAARKLEGGVLRRPFFWMCVMPFGLIAGGEAAFATLMPSYFHTCRGLSPEMAGALLTVHLLGLVAGRFASTALGGHVSNNTIIGACLAAGVFVVPALWTDIPAVRNICLFMLGVLFSSTWPTYYAQVWQFWKGRSDMLAFGSALGTITGISACVLISSMIAEWNMIAALFFGPAVLWAFGLLYFTTRLSRKVR